MPLLAERLSVPGVTWGNAATVALLYLRLMKPLTGEVPSGLYAIMFPGIKRGRSTMLRSETADNYLDALDQPWVNPKSADYLLLVQTWAEDCHAGNACLAREVTSLSCLSPCAL